LICRKEGACPENEKCVFIQGGYQGVRGRRETGGSKEARPTGVYKSVVAPYGFTKRGANARYTEGHGGVLKRKELRGKDPKLGGKEGTRARDSPTVRGGHSVHWTSKGGHLKDLVVSGAEESKTGVENSFLGPSTEVTLHKGNPYVKESSRRNLHNSPAQKTGNVKSQWAQNHRRRGTV